MIRKLFIWYDYYDEKWYIKWKIWVKMIDWYQDNNYRIMNSYFKISHLTENF